MAAYTIKINIVEKADATPNWLSSTWSRIRTVSRLYLADTRKMTALMLVMLLINEYTRPPKKALLIKGSVTVVNTRPALDPRSAAASSIPGSICCRLETPARIPIGSARMTNAAIRMIAVPVSWRG